MSFAPNKYSFDNSLPKAYGGCTCDCHRMPNVCHCAPCCYPSNEQEENSMNVKSEGFADIKGTDDCIDSDSWG